MPWLHFYEKNSQKNRDSTVYAWSGSYSTDDGVDTKTFR